MGFDLIQKNLRFDSRSKDLKYKSLNTEIYLCLLSERLVSTRFVTYFISRFSPAHYNSLLAIFVAILGLGLGF